MRWLERHKTVEYMASMRAKNAANYAKRVGGVWQESSWLKGAPIYSAHLLGGGLRMDVDPLFGAIEHRHLRGLHGLVSTILSLPSHGRPAPDFSLVPWPCELGWGVYVGGDEAAARLANSSHVGMLLGRSVRVKFSPLFKLRTPIIKRRGRRALRISTITPVAIRNHRAGHNATHHSPTQPSLLSTLVDSLPHRLGLPTPMQHVMLELKRAETRPMAVELGGKWGTAWGWDGEVEVVTNAIGHWLIAIAALIGLGGRTSVGFGRVRVVEV